MKRGKKLAKKLATRVNDFERSGLGSKAGYRKPGSLKNK